MKINVINSFCLDGRVAIVTGGSRGLGEVIASALAEGGASVALLSRSSRVHKVANELSTEHNRKCRGYICDVREPKAVQDAIGSVISDFDGLHILINNAGINVRGSIEDLSLEDYQQVQETNTTSAWMSSKVVAAHFKAQNYGKVVNIGSLLSILGRANRTPYAVSKGGVLQLTRALALEWAPFGITVNCIIPGMFATEMNVSLLEDRKTNEEIVSEIPLRRWGDPKEIAGLALYLSSDSSAYVTGAAMTIDGGWSVH